MAKTLDAAGVKRLIQEIKGANKNLNAPIPISMENTPESMAQNVKNIADYVEKAKAAGIDTTKSFRVTLEIEGYPLEGIYDIQYSYACGLQITDDGYAFLYNIDVTTGEVFTPCEIVTARSIQKVTSDMLAKGARRPIILTPDTTEVDEETYQKLLSDDVDVVFMTSTGDANHCTFTYKYDDGDVWSFTFTGFSHEGVSLSETYLYGYEVRITKTGNPHQCEVIDNSGEIQFDSILLNEGFIRRTTLTPILQEIDLTGTDAERKAKLDQFEADWMALTGASDLRGARFVGRFNINDYNSVGLFNYNQDLNYEGISCSDTLGDNIYKVVVNPDDGSLTITPLFSHLEAITIYTDNTPAHMQANLDNIAAYETNLQALGVTNVDGIMIPIKFEDDPENIATTFPFSGYITKYSNFYDGIVSTLNGAYNPRVITINGQQGEDGGKVAFETIALDKQLDNYTPKSLNAKSLEAITLKTGNTPDDKAANVAAINAYVDNLTALGVDVTKWYMIPCKFDNRRNGFIMPDVAGNYAGFIKDNDNYFGGGFVLITSNGTYQTLGLLTVGEYNSLTTTSKYIVKAINEVNALAEKKTDKSLNAKSLEAITIYTDNTPEHMQANLDNIAAYEANLQALGVDITKGWNAPVKVNAINGISPGIFASSEEKTNTPYTIISGLAGEYPYITRVNKTSGASTMWEILCDGRNYARITTNAKSIISAINEVNANAVHSDKLVPTLEAITIKTGNTPETKASNVAAIKAYVDNLKLLGVDVTKGYMIPAKLDSGNLDGFVSYHSDTVDYPWSGVFIRPGGSGKFGGMRKDGFVVLIDDILISASIYKTLTTTSKGIIPAINEVNALAKGYSTIFTPIELTTETAQNKTAIDARVAAFTAQGISLTNGCCIPVTYKGVYAGNISLINGDWYGLLVKNTNNPADNINIKLSADGTITEGNSAQ